MTEKSSGPPANGSAISYEDDTSLAQHHESNDFQDARPGTKRLFSNRESTSLLENLKSKSNSESLSIDDYKSPSHTSQNGIVENNEVEIEDALEPHSDKRHRSRDWPLKPSDSGPDAHQRIYIRCCSNTPTPPHSYKKASSLPRPSRFVEGSMKDRASKEPPHSYVGDDDKVRELYENGQFDSGRDQKGTQYRDSIQHTKRSTVPLSAAERPQSSIFRFGKSLAATFNLANWKIWSKPHEEEDAQQVIFNERQEKAEQVYRELQRTGQFRDSPKLSPIDSEGGICSHNKHDSGVGFSNDILSNTTTTRIIPKSDDTTKQDKRYSKVFLDPLGFPYERNESPASEMPSSPSKSSVHFKKPSLPNLKLAHTYENKKHPSQLSKLPSDSRGIRKIPSRKDLQKQQRLVKRVSDLEGKLEATRRQLSEALGEPVPVQPLITGRKRFTPGALATLPSERLLSTYTTPEVINEKGHPYGRIGQAISTNERSEIPMAEYSKEPEVIVLKLHSPHSLTTSETNKVPIETTSMKVQDIEVLELQTAVALESNEAQTQHNPITAASKKITKKRKSISLHPVDDDREYKPSANSEFDQFQAQFPIPRRNLARPRKLQKTDLQEPVAGKKTEAKAADSLSDVSPEEMISPPDDNSALVTDPSQRASRPHLIINPIPRKGLQSASLAPSLTGSIFSSTCTAIAKIALQEQNTSIAHDFDRSNDNVPPVPRLSRTVRLASGEVIHVEASMKPADEYTKTTVSLKDAKDEDYLEDSQSEIESIQRKKSFEWPADVF